jgi:hypothetical protein
MGSIPIARSTFRWLTLAYVVLGRARAQFSVPKVSMLPLCAWRLSREAASAYSAKGTREYAPPNLIACTLESHPIPNLGAVHSQRAIVVEHEPVEA